jgi:DNA-binding transcriptional ArsR family regulator|tara:strand:- start:17123 stop:17446 length:324 start_codon:yes stop_codon:yes gene_type:complete
MNSKSAHLIEFDPELMQANAAQAASLLKGLANESRLQILCTLMAGEMSVGQLNRRIPLSQSALSQHLQRLRKDGLLSTRRESQTIYYSLAESDALRVVAALHEIFCQ